MECRYSCARSVSTSCPVLVYFPVGESAYVLHSVDRTRPRKVIRWSDVAELHVE